MTDYTGQMLNERYRVAHLIGKGGMGSVYAGQHILIGRKVAIKFLHSQYVHNESTVARFYREAQAATAIGHKNIIEILDVGISDANEPYLVMEYLEGAPLSALIEQRGPLDLPAACSILDPVLHALSAAHRKGIVHRDLKPENIFLVHEGDEDDATVKLIDFGISKVLDTADNANLTEAGALIGTPAYMAPEQIKSSRDVDHRTDIYAIGVILFEMLTGQWPYVGETSNGILAKILTEAPRSPLDVDPDFPRAALPIIERALAREPSERYQDATEMRQALAATHDRGQRASRLTAILATAPDGQLATGSLGCDVAGPNDESVPRRVLSEVALHKSGPGWVDSRDNTAPSAHRPSAARPFKWLAVASLLVLASALVGGILLTTNHPGAEAVSPAGPGILPGEGAGAQPGPTAAPPSARAEQVEIELLNIPAAATIVFAGRPIATNPFKVPRSHLAAPLRVTAEGYRPFHAEVIPSVSRVIDIRLIEVEPQPEATAGAPHPGAGSATPPARETKPRGKKSDIRFRAGKKGAQIMENFE